jgi:hypothetical protein
MDPSPIYLILAVLACGLMAGAGATIARHKGRDPRSGMLIGYLLGPIGLVAMALAPRRGDAPGGGCPGPESDVR